MARYSDLALIRNSPSTRCTAFGSCAQGDIAANTRRNRSHASAIGCQPVACASSIAWVRVHTLSHTETCAHSALSTVRIFTRPCKGLSMSDQETLERTVLP